MDKNVVLPEIEAVISALRHESIPEERKIILQPLVDYLKEKKKNNEIIRLNFICTHNSRRSHLSQIWAQVMGYYFGFTKLFCYSGGTEATAMFPKVSETLSKQGFKVLLLSEGNNPVYGIKYATTAHPVICFSKTYDATFNPQSNQISAQL